MMGTGYYLGLDLGTSSVKAILADSHGIPAAQEKASYAQATPEGWSEAVTHVLRTLSEQVGKDSVCAIGLSS